MRLPAFLVGERVCNPAIPGGLWGQIVEVEKTAIALSLDGGGGFIARRGSGGFSLMRHGDEGGDGKRLLDPKGLEESKRCLREAVKSLKYTLRDNFLAGKMAGRAIKRDELAKDDRKYDELCAAKKALPLLLKILAAWESIPDDVQVPGELNVAELWDEARKIKKSVEVNIFE